ncbi:hypothetical protein, partial [Frankia sp. CpI1-P]
LIAVLRQAIALLRVEGS